MSEEEVKKLKRLIKEDNVRELHKIFNSNKILRNKFNLFQFEKSVKFNVEYLYEPSIPIPSLHFAVQRKSQKVVEYLLSQDFVDKTICNDIDENIYHVICRIRGAEELFSIIERKVPHHLLLKSSFSGINAFHIACEKNNIFIVKRIHEILQTSELDLTPIKKNGVMIYVIRNDNEVIKYVSSIPGMQLLLEELFQAIIYLKFDVIVHLLNVYLYQSIPSHLHNQFHIFQFSNLHLNYKNGILQYNNDDENNDHANDNDNTYLKLVEENFEKLRNGKVFLETRIWHEVCRNGDLDVVQLIFSLKGIQSDILKLRELNVFLLACKYNSNIKVIKYIHKLFPSYINAQQSSNGIQNGANMVLDNYQLNIKDRLKILHYLYLNGIDIHFLSKVEYQNQIMYHSIFTIAKSKDIFGMENMVQYLKVISQDFDYLHNEHDDNAYRKPSLWKEFHNNNNSNEINNLNDNNNNNNNNNENEQSMGINEWKNRFVEHVIHHLSKMIQQHMRQSNEHL